jgi:hypothetical protein
MNGLGEAIATLAVCALLLFGLSGELRHALANRINPTACVKVP